MVSIGINGFGRMGRMALCAALEHADVRVAGINEPFIGLEEACRLFQRDAAARGRPEPVAVCPGGLRVGQREIAFYTQTEPNRIDWADCGAAYIVEASGVFRTETAASRHLAGGARRVVVTAPMRDGSPMLVMGVNEQTYHRRMRVVSGGSSAVNCLAVSAQVLQEHFGIQEGLATLLYAAAQPGPIPAQWAAMTALPPPLSAARMLGAVIPALGGRFRDVLVRVPAAGVSAIDLSVRLTQSVSYGQVKQALREAACGRYAGILGYTEQPLLSTDLSEDTHSAVIDGSAGVMCSPNFVKLMIWFGNEWGYAHRIVELTRSIAQADA